MQRYVVIKETSSSARISPRLPLPCHPHVAFEIWASPTRLHRISPPSCPRSKQPQKLQIQTTVGTPTSGVALTISSSSGIRLGASSSTPDDDFLHNFRSSSMLVITSSVDPCSTDTLHNLHLGVSVSGASTTPADEFVFVNTSDVLIWSKDLVAIQSSLEDYSVIWLFNI